MAELRLVGHPQGPVCSGPDVATAILEPVAGELSRLTDLVSGGTSGQGEVLLAHVPTLASRRWALTIGAEGVVSALRSHGRHAGVLLAFHGSGPRQLN